MSSDRSTALVLSHAVVQFDDANFPSVVLQGDALASLFIHATNCVSRFRELSADCSAALSYARTVEQSLLHYEEILRQRGIALPYDISIRKRASQRLAEAIK